MLASLAIREGLSASYRWFFFTTIALALMVAPAAALLDPYALPPWELLALTAIPVVDAVILNETVISPIAVYLAVAAVALIVAVDVHQFTAVRMNRWFAVTLVVIATLAVGAIWNIVQWIADVWLGTSYLIGERSQDTANFAMMIDFVYATLAGFLAGILFTGYLRYRSLTLSTESATQPVTPRSDPDLEPIPSFVKGRFDISEDHVRWFSWAVQLGLGSLLLYGFITRDVPTITNAGLALTVTFLPAVLERNHRIPIEPELVIWLAAAAFLHTLGSAGLYATLEQWDTLTHVVSSSLVAAAGYTVVRAIDLHSDNVHLPSKTMVAFIVLFVLAVGVIWELVEFSVDFAAQHFGFDAALAQHGVDDTVGDLLFNSLGGIIAAILGAAYLTNASRQLAERLDT